MGVFDRSSKWLIERHGDALLRLAGMGGIVWWRALHSELVQTGQLPDGLLEVQFQGRQKTSLVVLEIATYPETRVEEQLLRDQLLVLLSRRILPNVLAVVLHPKGAYRVPLGAEFVSDLGWSRADLGWKVVEMWTLPASELLATGDPGLMPWVPLTQYDGPPEPIFHRCSEVIRHSAPKDERADLLAVTQVLARLRYNDPGLFQLLGGRIAMIESPLLDEIRAEGEARGRARAVLDILRTRFGAVPAELRERVMLVQDEGTLARLLEAAVQCTSLSEFETRR
jgi:hypothetical protein